MSSDCLCSNNVVGLDVVIFVGWAFVKLQVMLLALLPVARRITMLQLPGLTVLPYFAYRKSNPFFFETIHSYSHGLTSELSKKQPESLVSFSKIHFFCLVGMFSTFLPVT